MTSVGLEKIAQMTQAHYKLQVGCYLKDTTDLGGAIYSIGKYITDNYWNYASLVRTDANEAVELIERVEDYSIKNGRTPAFYLDPATKPANFIETLEKNSFSLKDQEIWMIHTNLEDIQHVRETPDVEVETVKHKNQMTHYIELFNLGFGMSTDAYGKSLYEAFTEPTKDVEIIHYLAKLNGKTCGVASLYSSGKVGGIYNVTSLPEFRRQGIGTALNKRAVLDSINRKKELLILQTEQDGDAYRIYERMGFRPGFLASIYQKH